MMNMSWRFLLVVLLLLSSDMMMERSSARQTVEGPLTPTTAGGARKSPHHRYDPLDLGPSPFVDEKTGLV